MGNGSDDDFTFCQVGSFVTENSSDVEAVQDVSKITLTDKVTNDDDSASHRSPQEGNFATDCLRKEEIVGSLSFSVTSAVPVGQSNREPGAQSTEGDGSFSNTPAAQMLRTKKPVTRTKVPFEKGYSQMDWFQLTRAHPDLAGLKGQSNRRLIPISEVKQHRMEGSMWTVLKGRVYNIYPYMKFHPGGEDMLMKAVGRDCTSLFNKYHAWVNDEFLLEKCLVGILDESGERKSS